MTEGKLTLEQAQAMGINVDTPEEIRDSMRTELETLRGMLRVQLMSVNAGSTVDQGGRMADLGIEMRTIDPEPLGVYQDAAVLRQIGLREIDRLTTSLRLATMGQADAMIAERHARAAERLQRAYAEQRVVNAVGDEKALGANEDARKRAFTIALAEDGQYCEYREAFDNTVDALTGVSASLASQRLAYDLALMKAGLWRVS